MKKVTLLSTLCLLGALYVLPMATSFGQTAPTFKYTVAPNQQIARGQTATYRMYVPDDIDMSDVRVAVFAKTVMYSSLRLELYSPTGTRIILKDAISATSAPWYGPLGTEDSYCLFRDGGISMTSSTSPNDNVFSSASRLSLLSGESAMGWWTLKFVDEATTYSPSAPQQGTWYAWSLMFNEIIQEPESVLFEQTLVGNSLTPQISGRHPSAGAVIPNYHGDLDDACYGGVMNLGKNGDCFPFIVTGIPGNIGDVISPFATPGRFELNVNIACNFNNGPLNGAYTEDIAIYFGQAVENFTGSLPTPPATYPSPTVSADWPTGPTTTTGSLYPNAPNGINGGVKLIGCNSLSYLAAGDIGGYSDVTFTDNAFTNIDDATPCGDIFDPSSGICGRYAPEQSLSAMNGARAVNGLYYVSIFDTYGESEAMLRDMNGDVQFGHIRVLSLTLRYLVGGGDTPSQDLHQGIASPLLGVPTPGVIDGTVLGYRTSVGNTIPPYTYHGITPTTNPIEREPILYFTNIQKLYQGSSIGYMHEELINTSTGAWSNVGTHGPLAWPGELDNNDFDATVNGNSSYADVIQIQNGSWKIRHKLVQARYDADASDNEGVGPEFHVTPNTFAYYGDKVNSWSIYSNPMNVGAGIPGSVGPGEGVGMAFTLFEYPNTKIVSVDWLLEQIGNGPTPQSNLRVTIWPVENGLTGEPYGTPVAQSPTVYSTQYIPGTENWRTFPVYAMGPNGIDLNNPGVDLAPGTYVVTLDDVGNAVVPYFPYTYGQAPTVSDRYYNYTFSDNFGPIGPYATLGTALAYKSDDVDSPPDVLIGSTSYPNFANHAVAMKLNMDYKNDFAIDYATFDGTLGNESVAMPNAPFVPSIYVSSRTLQNNGTADCNVRMYIYQGAAPGPNDYSFDQVVTLSPFQTIQVNCAAWAPVQAGSYTVEVLLSRAPNDFNTVNNTKKFDVYVSASAAIIARGNNAGDNDVNNLRALLEGRGHDVKIVDADDAALATATNSTIYLVGDASEGQMITSAASNGNTVAIVGQDDIHTVATSDKIFQVERASSYDVNEATLSIPMTTVNHDKPMDVEPVKINYTSKEDLLNVIAEHQASAEDVRVIAPTADVIAVANEAWQNVLPAATSMPFGELKYISEEGTGIVYIVPTTQKSTVGMEAPSTFALEQNYPNPFNPSTLISYSVPEDGQVTLRVLDLLGKEVASLVSDQKSAGTYTVNFNGVDNNGNVLPSGNYIYRIDVTTANGQQFSDTKKMTLSK